MLNHAIVRTDNMAGTDVRSMLVSVKYVVIDNNTETPTEIENGNVVNISLGLMDGEREIHTGTAVAANDNLNDVVLIATPEMIYERTYYALDDFINKAGTICRGYRLHSGDFFSVTAPALDLTSRTEPAKGDVVELAAGTKLKVVQSATNGSTQVGKIHAIETVGPHTFYVIKVD